MPANRGLRILFPPALTQKPHSTVKTVFLRALVSDLCYKVSYESSYVTDRDLLWTVFQYMQAD